MVGEGAQPPPKSETSQSKIPIKSNYGIQTTVQYDVLYIADIGGNISSR